MSPYPPPQPPPQQPYNYGPPPQQPYGYPQAPMGYPQQPYGYPQMPPPMVYAAPPVAPGAKTFEGLERLKTGTLLILFTGLLQMIVGLIAFSALTSVAANPGAALGAIALVLTFVLLVGLVGLIGLILGLWGLYTMHEGRAEFGPAHAAAVEKGGKMILYGVLINIVGGVATFFISFTLGVQGAIGGNFDALRTATIAGAVVGGLIGIVTTYMFAMGMQGFIEKLMTKAGRDRRQMFVMLSIIGAVVSFALGLISFVLFDPFVGGITNPGSASLAPLAGIISVIALWMYRMQVIEAENGARNMVRSGQYDPDAAGPAAPGMPPQMPPAMPPAQPMAPPPMAPPPGANP